LIVEDYKACTYVTSMHCEMNQCAKKRHVSYKARQLNQIVL